MSVSFCHIANPAKHRAGLTLIEAVVAIALFLVVVLAIYQAYIALVKVSAWSRYKFIASALANEELETIRNMPYNDIGLEAGLPAGTLPRSKTVNRHNIDWQINLSIRNIDDPFDGTIGGEPNDLSPADYKMIEVAIDCLSCSDWQTMTFNTLVAPKNLETGQGNGALFIKVSDSTGQPISQAQVRVENASVSPALLIEETTNNQGLLALVDAPPSEMSYKIFVSKSGYSSERTYALGEAGITNPIKPDATVLAGRLTQVSFVIDPLAEVKLQTIGQQCQPLSLSSLDLLGSKKIGLNPDVIKNNYRLTVNASGQSERSDIESDDYHLSVVDSQYTIAGIFPPELINLSPGSTNNLLVTLVPRVAKSLLVTVKDGISGLPLADAVVEISGSAYQQSQVTNRGYWRQFDWSAGPGQVIWSATDRFADSDGNIDYLSQPGRLTLRQLFSEQYVDSGRLTSSVFDTGSASTTYYNLRLTPSSQASSTGPDSIRFQLASSNDAATTTWNYLGPDGSSQTYYTATDTNISASHHNQRYLRYRLFMSTADPSQSPELSEVAITYGSECLPYGQVFFDGLATDTYQLTVSRDSYQNFSTTINLTADWQNYEVKLNTN